MKTQRVKSCAFVLTLCCLASASSIRRRDQRRRDVDPSDRYNPPANAEHHALLRRVRRRLTGPWGLPSFLGGKSNTEKEAERVAKEAEEHKKQALKQKIEGFKKAAVPDKHLRLFFQGLLTKIATTQTEEANFIHNLPDSWRTRHMNDAKATASGNAKYFGMGQTIINRLSNTFGHLVERKIKKSEIQRWIMIDPDIIDFMHENCVMALHPVAAGFYQINNGKMNATLVSPKKRYIHILYCWLKEKLRTKWKTPNVVNENESLESAWKRYADTRERITTQQQKDGLTDVNADEHDEVKAAKADYDHLFRQLCDEAFAKAFPKILSNLKLLPADKIDDFVKAV